VRNEDHRYAALAQPRDQRAQPFDVGARERRRRFVEQQDLGIKRERFGNLDFLPNGQVVFRDVAARIDVVDLEQSQQLANTAVS
jgi:hypothetical protein